MAAARRGRIVEGSCWSCRKQRVLCDLLKPACTRCQRSGQQCGYGQVPPVRWVGGTALRGRNAPAHAAEGSHETPHSEEMTLVHSPSTRPLDTESLTLYFANAVLPRFQLAEEGPLLDLGAVMRDEPLQQAVLAVAQAHHDLFSPKLSESSALCRRQTRHSAIQILRQRLELGLDSANTAQQLFVVNVLLCMLDGMIEPFEQTNASMCHLKGGHAMMNRWSNMPTIMLAESGLQSHLLSVFATMDLVHALVSGEKPYFGPLIWPMFSNSQAWFGRLSCNDRFLTLLKTFSEMATLGNLVASQLPSDVGVRVAEKCLPSVESMLRAQASDICYDQGASAPGGHWNTFCSLYELSGSIYLHRALRMCHVDDENVQAATRKGVEKLLDEALPGMMAHCVIFPILVIGAHCIHSQDRRAILQAISPSVSYLSFGNLQVMTDLLKDIWSKSDMQADWWDCFRAISEKVFLF